MPTVDVFVVVPSGSREPLGVVLSQEALDLINPSLPEGATVHTERAVRGEDGQLYLVKARVAELRADALVGRKAQQKKALEKLSDDEVALLGLEQLKSEVGNP